MPNCTSCGKSKPSTDLEAVGGKRAWCKQCLQPMRLVEDPKMEERSAPRLVFSMNVHEIDLADGGVDHRIEVKGNYGGLNLQYSATVDQIRKFFTERRESAERKLKSVK